MLKHIQHNEIDKQKWDAAIGRSGYPVVYGCSWFLDRVSPGWQAIIEDDYSAVMPLTVKQKRGFSYIARPPFCQQLGVFSSERPASYLAFIEAIPSDFRIIDISFNKTNAEVFAHRHSSRRINYELMLNKPYEELYNTYSAYTRRKLRVAMRHKLRITKEVRPDDLLRLFRENKGKELNNLDDAGYTLIQKIMNYALENGIAEFYGALTGTGQLCAAGFFIHAYGRYIYLFSGTNSEGRTTAGNFLFIDRFIHNHSGESSILDFEGSIIPSLAIFYEGFGSTAIPYPHLRINRLPWYFRWLMHR